MLAVWHGVTSHVPLRVLWVPRLQIILYTQVGSLVVEDSNWATQKGKGNGDSRGVAQR